MDEKDRAILNIIQGDFPVEARPFAAVANRLEMTEEEVVQRVARMKGAGIIRRIGAVFNPGRLGYVSTLCAAVVPPEREETFIAVVNAHPGVTHHYRRDGEYNCWFTLICRHEAELMGAIADIKEKTGIGEIVSLRATATYKIDARFEV
ncbi:MAG: AsnC family transcriptional regulator [Syntrophales bacterium]|nr:AsnC family transcriptional regulator [Syntrophales bacterium]